MNRAKEIAAKIIADVWPKYPCGKWLYDAMEAAIEKHMLPHQVRDHVGIIWEQMSDGCYRTLNGAKTDYIDRNFGPLTEVHGEPPPDAGEVAKLKERIAEKEKLSISMEIEHDEIMQAAIKESDGQRKRIDELAGLCGKQKERIAELENDLKAAITFDVLRRATVDSRDRQIAELEKLSAKQPEAIWQQIGDRLWAFGVLMRGVVRERKAFVRDCGSAFAWGAGDSCGSAHAFIEAIEAAEKAMGIS